MSSKIQHTKRHISFTLLCLLYSIYECTINTGYLINLKLPEMPVTNSHLCAFLILGFKPCQLFFSLQYFTQDNTLIMGFLLSPQTTRVPARTVKSNQHTSFTESGFTQKNSRNTPQKLTVKTASGFWALKTWLSVEDFSKRVIGSLFLCYLFFFFAYYVFKLSKSVHLQALTTLFLWQPELVKTQLTAFQFEETHLDQM